MDERIETFKKALESMIATSDNAYGYKWGRNPDEITRDYSKEEIEHIIDNGTLSEKVALSRNYFKKDGFYRRIILHYATLLKYQTLLIPNPINGQKLSNGKIKKRYFNALNYVETMNLPMKAANWSIAALRDGSYYGVIVQLDKQHFTMLDLPSRYCRSRFKDFDGNHVIEFNVQYFDTLNKDDVKNQVLSIYPKYISNYYKKWSKSKNSVSQWCLIPTEVGICFKLADGMPMFLKVITASLDYDEAVETENERERDEIKKIIVQKIPHLTDGGLLFEPEEAAVMHQGAVQMLKGNKNVSVLTTYADVEGIVSKTSGEAYQNNLEKMVQNIYYEAGASGQLFASNSNLSLSTSLTNDMALMMLLVNQYNNFITKIINQLFGYTNVNFKLQFLPITWYNETEYVQNAFKLATSGYSLMLPAIGLGVSQRDIVNLKDLENDLLELTDKLVPLETAWNKANGEGEDKGGAPTKKPQEKSAQTVANEKSLDKGGSN